MGEWTEVEISLLWDMLDDMGDNMVHHPDDYPEEDIAAHSALRDRARFEGRKLMLWWVR